MSPAIIQQRILVQAAQDFFSSGLRGTAASECTTAGRQYMAEAIAWQMADSLIRRTSDPDYLSTLE